ncbi:MAG: hypothetical protein M3409_10555 [Gemmatimonadota bacterium]|nr:hypothetical protein [Gemmatimonadota bacterium]
MSTREERVERARALLEGAGLPEARVETEGTEGEIAAIHLPAEQWGRLEGEPGREISARLRSLGFRYVAVDLAPLPRAPS